MSPNCPNCGANLNVSSVGSSTATPTTAAAAVVLANKGSSHDGNPTNASLQRLKHIMCFPFNPLSGWKPTQPTMRPVVSDKEDEVGLIKDYRARQTLDLVARRMHATIRACGEQSADTLLESRRHGQAQDDPLAPMHTVFEVIGAMIYAMEWTSGEPWAEDPVPSMGPLELVSALEAPPVYSVGYSLQLPRLFELMLVIDYGFPAHPICGSICGPMLIPRSWFLDAWAALERLSDFLVKVARAWRWRQGLPSDESWNVIACATWDWANDIGLKVPVWDVATMIYYYRLHRNPADAEEHKEGWIGYTGVLQEMIAEIPARGRDRLERKLSLDAHLFIQRFVRDRKLRKEMLLAAQDIALKHGCKLAPPEMPKPPLWRRLIGQVRLKQRPDRRKCPENVKLLERTGWESKGEEDDDPSCPGG